MAFPNRAVGSTGRVAVEGRYGTPSDELTGQKPIKTLVGSTGRGPIKTIAGTPRTDTRPLKTIVGSTARPPIKTKVGSTARPPLKTIVGSTAEPPRKTTPGNLGTGGINPLGMDAADRGPINAGNPQRISRSLGNGDGNPGRSVAPMPPPAQGPPNPTMDWAQPWNVSGIQDGAMGPAAKEMSVAPPRGLGGGARGWNAGRGGRPREMPAGRASSRRTGPNRPSQFFGE